MPHSPNLSATYVTTFGADDLHAWSGLISNLKLALEGAGIHVTVLSHLRKEGFFRCTIKRVFYRLRGQDYQRDRDPALVKGYARQISKRLDPNCDFIFSPGTLAIGHYRTDQPMVIWTDATFANLVDTYPEFQNLCAETLRDGHAMEREVLNRVTLAIYSSEWAAQSAIRDYGVDPSRVKVIPFGANLECQRNESDIHALIAKKSRQTCRLLFVGVDWQRKGGDLAIAVAEQLNAQGFPTELHVVGVKPPAPSPPFVISHGFLSKKNPSELATLNRLMEECHFFILPSVSECFGVVFAEAASFGLPSLATRVGGISSALADGLSGYLFDPPGSPEEFCQIITQKFQDPEAYLELSNSTFRHYQDTVNWKVAGEKARAAITAALAGHSCPSPS